MRTPQKEWFKRARSFWMCTSPQVGLCHIQELGLWHGGACVGNKIVINQKQVLLVMVGINIIFSVRNEYVKLAWGFTGKPWQE